VFEDGGVRAYVLAWGEGLWVKGWDGMLTVRVDAGEKEKEKKEEGGEQ
jgi:hypothetical protein